MRLVPSAGCVAARDDWLADLARWGSGKLTALYTVAGLWLVALCAGTATFLFAYPPSPACAAAEVEEVSSGVRTSVPWPAPPPPAAALSAAYDAYEVGVDVCILGALFGVFTVAFSLAVLHFSSLFFNFTGPRCDFFSQAVERAMPSVGP